MRNRIYAPVIIWGLIILAGMLRPAGAQDTDPAILEYPQTALKGFVTAEFSRSASDCRTICEQRTGCVGFDHSARNMCRIFAAVASGQSDLGFTAGTRNRIRGYRDPANLDVKELTPPPEQDTWHYAQFSDVDFYGGDLFPKGLQVHDPALCASACETDSSCHAYTFNAEQNRCFLKTGHQFVQGVAGVTSGMYFKAKQSEATIQLNAEWDLFLQSDLPGHDIGEYPARTYDQCMRQCEGVSSCAGFTWVYGGRKDHCYLKSGPGLYPARFKKGMVSASKINRDVYPDFVRPAASRDQHGD
ncbi:PAN domain-containing protein [Rhizobium giardinii]|uniref:PAN domain-containing protein n=1 Tax=Rhizobium giardinii TaxID=56731 RepID=UPI003D6DE3BB